MSKTKIEWTEETWNPVRGCEIVSKGCQNCYAMKQAHRFSGEGMPYEGLTMLSNRGPVWNGKVIIMPELLEQPLKWRKPRKVFVNSMSDLFHKAVPDEFIAQVFAVMDAAKQHQFQILTKRPERMMEWCQRVDAGCEALARDFLHVQDPTGRDHQYDNWPLPNVHLGVSVEDQQTANERIPALMKTPAVIRFISAEPLLSPVDLREAHISRDKHPRVNSVIVGGESGHKARPMALGWAKDIVRQCKAAGVPVFVKQLGAKPTNREGKPCPLITHSKGADMSEWPAELQVREYPAEVVA